MEHLHDWLPTLYRYQASCLRRTAGQRKHDYRDTRYFGRHSQGGNRKQSRTPPKAPTRTSQVRSSTQAQQRYTSRKRQIAPARATNGAPPTGVLHMHRARTPRTHHTTAERSINNVARVSVNSTTWRPSPARRQFLRYTRMGSH